MSWGGGGERSPTPAIARRTLAIHGDTWCPGSWPPSPGLAPWAILIWRSSALTRYSLVTPKRPEAICLIALRRGAPVGARRWGQGAVGLASVGQGTLAALPVLGLAPEPVHGDRERLVRLEADRAVGHGS